MPPANDVRALLAEDRWIRRLAAGLVGDPSSADDLVQEAYLTALSGAERPRSARAWLGGVVRNLWRDAARSGARRARRERVAARPEALPSSAELAAEVELRRRVAEAVLALDEPLRHVVVLRFFRDRPLPAIAEALGVGVSTVHDRLERALARLRRELDRAHGGRRDAWSVTLLPLAKSAGPAAMEVIAMTSAIKLTAAAAVALLGAGAAWWWSEARREPAVALATEEATRAPAGGASRAVRAEAAPVAREPLAPPTAAEPPASAPAEPARVAGRVVDTDGDGVGAVALAWKDARESDARATSRADGSFELARGERDPEDAAAIVCVSPELVTLVSGQAFGGWSVVVAPRASFVGTVVDEAGAPVAGASLEFRVRESVFRSTGAHTFAVELEGWRVASGADGRFALPSVTGGPDVYLAASAHGFADEEVALREGGDASLWIELARRRSIELTGVVLDPLGAPVPGASVSAGRERVLTDGEGRFSLHWNGGNGKFERGDDGTWREGGADRSSVIALKAGLRPVQESLRERDLATPFMLRLGEPISIAGTVRDPDGHPLAGIVLWLRDPTRFATETRTSVEGTDLPRTTTVEDEVCERGSPAVLTDEHGRFELGCLMQRDYAVLALDPRSSSRAGPWTLSAGASGVELVFAPEPTARVAGRVVSATGRPRAGVRLTPRRTTSWEDGAEAPQLGGAETTVTTDAEGRFAFERLATEGTSLLVAAPPFSIRIVPLGELGELGSVEIVEPELREAQVELAGDPDGADGIRILDESGVALELNEVVGDSRSFAFTMDPDVALVDGRSRVFHAPETGRTLVLLKDGAEVLRMPIELEPGRRTVLRP